jgi:hypothetical protein
MHALKPAETLQVEYNGIPLAGIWKVDGMK